MQVNHKYEAHELALVFPEVTGEEFENLKQDIKENGLVQPITLYQGLILDGRNRYKACLEVEVTPKFTEFKGDEEGAIKFVVSSNLHRRHLTASQKAALAVELKSSMQSMAERIRVERIKESASVRPRQENGTFIQTSPNLATSGQVNDVRETVAKVTGASNGYISQAERIKEEAPEVFEKVLKGEVNLNQAKEEIKTAATTSSLTPPRWSEEETKLKDYIESTGRSIVINMSTHKNLRAWAEAKGIFVKIDRSSIWGNPFELPKDGARDYVCESYEQFYLPRKPSLLNQIENLRGKVLGCWCHPQNCHGRALYRALYPENIVNNTTQEDDSTGMD